MDKSVPNQTILDKLYSKIFLEYRNKLYYFKIKISKSIQVFGDQRLRLTTKSSNSTNSFLAEP